VFLVRKGNPKGIKDWDDLVKPGIERHHAQPQDLRRRPLELPGRLGLCRSRSTGGNDAKARNSSKKLSNVPVLDSGARGSTTTFVERGIGDVLLAWENEAFWRSRNSARTSSRSSPQSLSILAEPPVTVVDKVVDKRGTAQGGQAYLEYLYSAEGQDLAGKHYYRPTDPSSGRQVRQAVPEGEPVHHRRSLRRLGQGAEDALCRRRRAAWPTAWKPTSSP
jgi:sulfate/thiosulfate-binding protein